MKSGKLIVSFLLLFVVFASFEGLTAQNKAESQEATFNIPTIKGKVCQRKIEKGLKKLDGVESVEVNVDEKTGTVNYNPAKVNESDLKIAISELGHKVEESKDCCEKSDCGKEKVHKHKNHHNNQSGCKSNQGCGRHKARKGCNTDTDCGASTCN